MQTSLLVLLLDTYQHLFSIRGIEYVVLKPHVIHPQTVFSGFQICFDQTAQEINMVSCYLERGSTNNKMGLFF